MDGFAKVPISKNPRTMYKGVAAEDLKGDSVVLKVILTELLTNSAFGTVAAGITENAIKLNDRDGRPINSRNTTSNHVVATWEGASNSRYAPMVREGEPVEVYREGDQDKFLWKTTGRGRDFRKTDRVYVEIGATDPSKPGVDKDDTNTYSAYLDSENKKIGFKTSKANGEVAAFTMEGDLAAGRLVFSDDGEDPGNRIVLDTGHKTGKPFFQVNLKGGIVLKMEGDDFLLKVPGKAAIDVGDRLLINSPITYVNPTKAGTVIIKATHVAIDSTKDIILKAGNVVGVYAKSTKIGGVLIAAAIRCLNVVKGPAGGSYSEVTISRPEETPVSLPNNTADTDMTGLPYKTS